MTVAIVEDELAIAKMIKRHIMQFGERNNEKFDVAVFHDGLDFFDGYKSQYNIILMDIEMPHSNGMEIARRVRSIDSTSVIMFITNIAAYAIQGYSVGAIDYVLKPLSYESFSFRFKRALAAVIRSDVKKINIKSDKTIVSLKVDDISYIEIINHSMIIHTLQGAFETWCSLSSIEQRLPENQFARCNNCYLVNLKYIQEIRKETVLINDVELKISRNKKKAFLQAITAFI